MRRFCLALSLSFWAGTVLAMPSQCPQYYVDGQRPDLGGQEFCLDGYSTVYDARNKGAVYSAEHLTRDSVEKAYDHDRYDAFHPDFRVSGGPRPGDYHHTGYDRGHLAPSADAPTRHAQYDTFNMLNMTPQTPGLNRHAWNYIERGVRRLAKTFGEVYVVTGAIYGGDARLPRGEAIPTSLWKAIYIPARHQCRVYVAPNTKYSRSHVENMAEFSEKTGITPFSAGLCQ